MNIGKQIRKFRNLAGLTQAELGLRLEKTQQEVYRWEKGIVRVPAENLPAILEALGVSASVFFEEIDLVDSELSCIAKKLSLDAKGKLIEFLEAI